jgi:hypothetical protein
MAVQPGQTELADLVGFVAEAGSWAEQEDERR